MNDDELIREVLSGRRDSFKALVERHSPLVYGFCANLIPDRHEREDIAQDVFLSAYDHLRTYDTHRARFATWLLTMARNRCVNALKKRIPVSRDPTDLPSPRVDSSPNRRIEEREVFRHLDEALDNLPLPQRTIFVLAELYEFSHAEIGEIERIEVGTVKSRLSRAKARLRTILAPCADSQS